MTSSAFIIRQKYAHEVHLHGLNRQERVWRLAEDLPAQLRPVLSHRWWKISRTVQCTHYATTVSVWQMPQCKSAVPKWSPSPQQLQYLWNITQFQSINGRIILHCKTTHAIQLTNADKPRNAKVSQLPQSFLYPRLKKFVKQLQIKI